MGFSLTADAQLSGGPQTTVDSQTAALLYTFNVAGGTPTLVVTVQGKDIASGSYYNILTSAALATTGFTLMQIAVGLTAVSNLTGSANIPRTWRVQAVVGGVSPAVTATIGASLT